jgi:prepilin-type processing-associated H-X9-DG protein
MLQFSMRKMMLGVVVLAVLSAIIAACERARAFGKKQECERRLRDLGLGLQGYYTNKSAFPPGTWPNANLAVEDRISMWGPVSIFLDRMLWQSVEESKAWHQAGINDAVSRNAFNLCACPEATRPAEGMLQPMSYIGIAGMGADSPLLPKIDPRAGVFGYDRQTTLADIKDGAPSTMLIAESAQVRGSWFEGGPATVRGLDSARQPYIGPARQFGGLHSGGAYVAMADGSVRWISESISPRVFEALSTIAEGESLPADW